MNDHPTSAASGQLRPTPDFLAGRDLIHRKAFERIDPRKARDIVFALHAINNIRGLGTVCCIKPVDLALGCFFDWDYERYECHTLDRLLARMQRAELIQLRRERRGLKNEVHLEIEINWEAIRRLPDNPIVRCWAFPDLRREQATEQLPLSPQTPRQTAGETVPDPDKMSGSLTASSRQNVGSHIYDRTGARATSSREEVKEVEAEESSSSVIAELEQALRDGGAEKSWAGASAAQFSELDPEIIRRKITQWKARRQFVACGPGYLVTALRDGWEIPVPSKDGRAVPAGGFRHGRRPGLHAADPSKYAGIGRSIG